MPGAKSGDEGTWGGSREYAESVVPSAVLVCPHAVDMTRDV
jgi:hypothetical protein